MTIYDVFKGNMVLEKILNQQSEYNVNLSYRLYKLRKKLNEIEEFTMERLKLIFGDGFDSENFNDNEKVIYNGIMLSEIEEDFPIIRIDEVIDNYKVVLSVEDMAFVEKIFA